MATVYIAASCVTPGVFPNRQHSSLIPNSETDLLRPAFSVGSSSMQLRVISLLGISAFIAIAWVMRKAMRTSGSETLSAAANIFMGQTEAPLLIKPYISGMTRSELLCMMVGGMATIAGGVAAVYAKMGADAGHPEIAGHLLTASVMNAPAALLISKVMLPETEPSQTAGAAPKDPHRTTTNSIDALCPEPERE